MHDHKHEHAHVHTHDGGDCCETEHTHEPHTHNDEYLEQLLTVGICAAFGTIAIITGYEAVTHGTGMLRLTLAKPFWPWVLGGGIALLAMSIVRGIVLFRNTGAACCNHSHETGEHSHGSAFWKAVILMFPLALFCMNLPNKGFSAERIAKMLGPNVAINIDDLRDVQAKETAIPVTFDDVANALRTPALQEVLTGTRTGLRGQLQKISDREFTLYTIKMTCCSSDSVPLKARIVILNDDFGSSLNSKGYQEGDWLEVRGVLQFVEVPGKKEPLPLVKAKLKDIQPTTPDL